MRRRKEILRIILAAAVAVFLLLGVAGVLLLRHDKDARREAEKKAAMEALESITVISPTPVPTITPTPIPTATPTPTPVIEKRATFNPDEYWDYWYSTDGLATINVYNISQDSISFYFSQANPQGTSVCEADVSAEVAGNAAQLSFTDSQGNYASGSVTFDNGQLYLHIQTDERVEGISVSPSVNCIMVRERPQVSYQPTPTPIPQETQTQGQTGDYYFADSNSRYLTDEELQNYSSSDLELAKNEIYARHGRQFVTQRISDYFNSKSWYQGTVDPDTFDAQQDQIFNEYELANISKIAQWEEIKRSQGQ